MNVFVFCVGTETPFFETELELIRKHEEIGDRIRVIQCDGNLSSCQWNQERKRSFCARCRSRFKNGFAVLDFGNNVELKQFPLIKISHLNFPSVFDSVDEIKRYQYDGEKIGFGIASSLISGFRDHRFDTQKHSDRVIRILETSIQVYETLKREFEEFKPDRVYVFNGRIATHLPAILLCKRMGIEYFVYEAAGAYNKYMLRQNSTVHDISAASNEMDTLWASAGSNREKLARLYFEQVRAGCNFKRRKSFTKYQSKGLLPNQFYKNKKNIVIFNSTIGEYAAIEGWENLLYEPDETAGIRRILESIESDSRYMFYLRVHPHMKEFPDTTSQLNDIRDINFRFDNLHVIWPEDLVDSYALMDGCEKVVTFGSTMGIEASYWGKQSILAGRAIYERLDCVYVPKTHDELVKLLNEDVELLPVDSALKYGYWRKFRGIPYEYYRESKVDGQPSSGSFEDVIIKPDLFPDLWYQAQVMPSRLKTAINNPSLILEKVKTLCRYLK